MSVLSTQEMLDRPEPTWRIEGLIPENGFVLLVGPRSVGKSFLALDLAAHMSLGHAWLGKTVRQTNVVYAALEGMDKRRIEAWRNHNNVDSVPDLHWIEDGFDLRQAAHRDAPIEAVTESEAEFLIIDTLNRSLSRFDENGSVDMGLIVDFADRLRRDAASGLLVPHHTPREGRNPRGHTSLEDGADTILWVTQKSKDSHVLEVSKQRNGEEGEQIRFRIVTHESSGSAVIAAVGPSRKLDQPKGNESRLVQCLVQKPSVVPGTYTQLMRRAEIDIGMVKSSFTAALNGLVSKEILDHTGEGKGAQYVWGKNSEEMIRRLLGDDGPT